MSRTLTKFFTFPSTRTKLEHELQKSAILSSLWSTPTGTNHINSPHTLPQEIKPKSEIYKEVEAENAAAPQIQIKFKQSFDNENSPGKNQNSKRAQLEIGQARPLNSWI